MRCQPQRKSRVIHPALPDFFIVWSSVFLFCFFNTAGSNALRTLMTQSSNNMFEAFKTAEDLKHLCQWLEGWTYQKVKSGN
jgi:hypothetical protein